MCMRAYLIQTIISGPSVSSYGARTLQISGSIDDIFLYSITVHQSCLQNYTIGRKQRRIR